MSSPVYKDDEFRAPTAVSAAIYFSVRCGLDALF